ncbi:MAG: isoprenylcysteine carboxylmethyltransferase family protein [Pirellulaceae bacterium]|nr:isoprenylcysteine carboxylmethyltransferase family protein [Pirellulaceae bacterium]
MADDNTMRLALLVVLVVFAPFAILGRINSMTTERLDRWQEGGLILFGLRLGAVPLFLAGVAWMIDPQWMGWSSIAIPPWLRWIGIATLGFSGSLVLWMFWNLGKNLTDTVVTRKEHTLVTSGPYRFVRHPFYAAFALGVLGVSMAMANWFIPLAGAVPLGFIVARTSIEEQKLIDRFGVEYRDYMLRVGRFWPRWPVGRARRDMTRGVGE